MARARSGRVGAILLIGGVLLVLVVTGVFVATMSPLEALSSPFRFLVTTRIVPERLTMEADVQAVDAARLSETVRSLVTSEQLRTDGDGVDPTHAFFYEASFSDKNGVNLLISQSSGHSFVQIFQDHGTKESIRPLIAATSHAFAELGFKEDTTP